MKRLLNFIIFFFSLFTVAFSTTINIPSDYSTIQAGLNAANEGDTVIVESGVYSIQSNVNILEKVLLYLKPGVNIEASENGRFTIAGCIVALGTEQDSVKFTCSSGYWGGFNFLDSSPSYLTDSQNRYISGNYFKHCSIRKLNRWDSVLSQYFPINFTKSSAFFQHCLFRTNIDENIRSYALVRCSLDDGDTLRFESCSFTDNDFHRFMTVDRLIMNNCVFANNSILYSLFYNGGAQSQYFVTNFLMISNELKDGCEGVFSGDCSKAVLTNSKFINNTLDYYHLVLIDSDVEVRGCFFENNSIQNSYRSSSLIKIYNGGKLLNNTFINNSINNSGSIINLWTDICVPDCIAYNNFLDDDYTKVLMYRAGNDVNMENNYWNSTESEDIEDMIYHNYDDLSLTLVDFEPYLSRHDIAAPPIPVQNLQISSIGNDFIELSWDPSPLGDLSGYKICYKTDVNEFFYPDTIDVGNVTSYSLSGLSAGSTYYIAAICYDTDGNNSWYSNEVVACPQPAPLIHTSTSEIDYGTVVLGDTSERVLTISNQGTAELNVTDIFSLNSQFIPSYTIFDLPVGEQKEITIKFIPEIYGQITSNLVLNSNAYNDSALIVILSGFGDLSPEPQLLSIIDIPDDQGGKVRLKFRRSKYDGLDSTYKIVSYTVWRLIENSDWDAVGMFNAVQDSFYYFVAPTLGDSTIHGIIWSTFKVSAHTQNPDIFFYSDSLRGYSIDNIAPGVPEGLLASTSNGNILLIWQPNSEKDFQHYGIYRSTCSNFDPDTMDIYTYATSDTFIYDSDIEGNINYYYRVSAFDYSGNESDYSPEVSALVVGLQSNGENVPGEYSLSQNYPNPFNPTTTISYQLPKSSFVKLTIYDISGRLVDKLIDEKKNAGYYSVEWNAENVCSGVYFYRIEAGSFVAVKKGLLVK